MRACVRAWSGLLHRAGIVASIPNVQASELSRSPFISAILKKNFAVVPRHRSLERALAGEDNKRRPTSPTIDPVNTRRQSFPDVSPLGKLIVDESPLSFHSRSREVGTLCSITRTFYQSFKF